MPKHAVREKYLRDAKITPPKCVHCGTAAVPSTLNEVFGPGVIGAKPDEPVWVCPVCDDSHVRCHRISDTQFTMKPKGRPANAAVRRFRVHLHKRMDPMWSGANELLLSEQAARTAMYRYMAVQMETGEFHIGDLDYAGCIKCAGVLDKLEQSSVANNRTPLQQARTELLQALIRAKK